MKQGRGRVYFPIKALHHELDYLAELRLRAADLLEDLDEEARRIEHAGHSIGELFQHMINAEFRWVSQLGPQSTQVIPNTVERLEMFSRAAFSRFSLNDPIQIGTFISIDEMLRHLQWHWTYHAGQIGLLRRAQDQRYQWNFKA